MTQNPENNSILEEQTPEITQPTDNVTEAAAETSEADSLRADLAEQKEKYLRLYADFENFRRRTAKEKLDLIANANEDLLKTLLPVLDDFERAMASFDTVTEVEALKEGVGLIFSKLFKTLEARGLKPMTAKSEVFDADLHESVTQFPAPTEDLKGRVIDELEKGYFLHEKVIRYAKVVVGA